MSEWITLRNPLAWQQSALDEASESYRYVIQAPRQNGKTAILQEAAVRAALLNDERVVYVSESLEMSRHNLYRMLSECCPEVDAEIDQVRRSASNMRVTFKNKSFILFASFRQSGRGVSAGTIVVDNADHLTEDQMFQMAGTGAGRWLFGCVLPDLFSPVHKIPDGAFYCYDGPDTFSREAWEIANPSAGSSILPWARMARMRSSLTEKHYRREILATGPVKIGRHDPLGVMASCA